jgi:hypothetical protein
MIKINKLEIERQPSGEEFLKFTGRYIGRISDRDAADDLIEYVKLLQVIANDATALLKQDTDKDISAAAWAVNQLTVANQLIEQLKQELAEIKAK